MWQYKGRFIKKQDVTFIMIHLDHDDSLLIKGILFFNCFLKIYRYKLLRKTLFHNIWISDVNYFHLMHLMFSLLFRVEKFLHKINVSIQNWNKSFLYSSYKLLKPLIRIRCSEFVDIRWKLQDSGQVRFPDLIWNANDSKTTGLSLEACTFFFLPWQRFSQHAEATFSSKGK